MNFLICLLCFCGSCLGSKPPHIIFIMIDDLGWNDVSFHGSKQIPTPNIDSLAKDGVILHNYYVQPICTPSRGAVMTGKYPLRLGLQHDVIYAEEPWGLSPKEKILPQYLKELGYVTRGIGKWHLGYFNEQYLPLNRGFDSFFGYWNGKEDFYTHFEEGQKTNGLDFHDDNTNAWNYTGHYSTDLFTDKAVSAIKSHNASKPLFLYLAYQAVHAGNSYIPLQAPPEYVKRFSHIQDRDRRIFAGMVSKLDDSIGDLVSALDASSMLQDSVIVVTTDNGAAVEGIDQSTGSNWPLRGSKYNMWEGGIRGVAFVWSPSLRNASVKVSMDLIHITDWLPTLFYVAGGDPKTLNGTDGFNIWPSICCSKPTPRNIIIHNIDPLWKVEAVRKGPYKLLKGSVFDGNFDGWFSPEGKRQASISSDVYQKLYDKIYAISLQKSKVRLVLSKLFGLHNTSVCEASNEKNCLEQNFQHTNLEPSLQVFCGPKPKNESESCNPLRTSCLFDISKDPCEYHNLISVFPDIVEELESVLDKFRTQSVPTRNKPLDPLANPKYHGYAWIPWKSTEEHI